MTLLREDSDEAALGGRVGGAGGGCEGEVQVVGHFPMKGRE